MVVKKVLVSKPVLNDNDNEIHLSFRVGFMTDYTDYIDVRKFIEGPIELLAIPFVVDGINYDIFINEEGKLKEGLLPSICLFHSGEIYDVVMGNFFISKSDAKGDTVDLTFEEIRKVHSFILDNIECFRYVLNGNIIKCNLLKLDYSFNPLNAFN